MALDKNGVVPNSSRGRGDLQRIPDEVATRVFCLPPASSQACDAGLLVFPPCRAWAAEGSEVTARRSRGAMSFAALGPCFG